MQLLIVNDFGKNKVLDKIQGNKAQYSMDKVCRICEIGVGRLEYTPRTVFGAASLYPYSVTCEECGTVVTSQTEDKAIENFYVEESQSA